VENMYRIKEFDIDYDSQVIETAKAKVIECRDYIKELLG
jgi:hypothetical protein